MDTIKKYCLLIIFIFSICGLKASDTIPVKRHYFVIKLSNAGLLRIRESYNYVAPSLGAHLPAFNGNLYTYSTYFNPKIEFGYEYSLAKHLNPKRHNYNWWSLCSDIGFKESNYHCKYIGNMSGSLTNSNVNYENKYKFGFFCVSAGIKYNWKNYQNTTFGISIAASHAQWYFQRSETIVSDYLGNKQFVVYIHNRNSNILYNFNAYNSIEGKFSIGKKIGRKNLGLFLEYSVSDFTLLNKFYWIYSSGFLKDYHCIYLGTYFNL